MLLNFFPDKTQQRIRDAINRFLGYLNQGVAIPGIIDVKRMKGKRKEFTRLKIGKIRVLFKVNTKSEQIKIHAIDYRGNIYKGEY